MPGWYKVTASAKDKNGEEIKFEKYIELTDTKVIISNQPILLLLINHLQNPAKKSSILSAQDFRMYGLSKH
jgi:hypothetical protein